MTSTNLAPLPTRTVRNASLEDLITILQAQTRQRLDVVAPLSSLRYSFGNIELAALDAVVHETGTYDVNGLYQPTDTADMQLAGILDIPVKYMRKLREQHITLLDTNVNAWCERVSDNKMVLLRTLWGSGIPGTSGIVRAILSDRYNARDNFDTLVSAVDGLRAAGLKANNMTISGNLTDNRMSLFVEAPEIFVNAPELLGNYRPPTDGVFETRIQPGQHVSVNDTIHAGIAISNSETGGGALSITPRVVVLKCLNGWQITKDAFRKVHIGARLDEGQIVWSGATRDAANELAKQQVKDAVQAFLNVDYLTAKVNEVSATATVPLVNVTKTLEVVAQKMSYSQAEQDLILGDFIQGGQVSALGVLQAVTSVAQRVEDPDRAFDLEAGAVQAMETAAAFATVR